MIVIDCLRVHATKTMKHAQIALMLRCQRIEVDAQAVGCRRHAAHEGARRVLCSRHHATLPNWEAPCSRVCGGQRLVVGCARVHAALYCDHAAGRIEYVCSWVIVDHGVRLVPTGSFRHLSGNGITAIPRPVPRCRHIDSLVGFVVHSAADYRFDARAVVDGRLFIVVDGR